ncbi:peptidoglycan-binding protein [Methylomagnum ishizawai]
MLPHDPASAVAAFGPGIERALEGFQASQGLVADGIAGPQVRRALGIE